MGGRKHAKEGPFESVSSSVSSGGVICGVDQSVSYRNENNQKGVSPLGGEQEVGQMLWAVFLSLGGCCGGEVLGDRLVVVIQLWMILIGVGKG